MKSAYLVCMLAAGLLLEFDTASAETTEAKVTFSNCGDYAYSGVAAAGGSVTTTTCGLVVSRPVTAEGGADFSASPQLWLNMTSDTRRGVDGLAYLDDYVTFHVANGGSAVVTANISGSFQAKLYPSFSVTAALGSDAFGGTGSTTDSIDGNPGTDLYFPQTGDPLSAAGVVGSYSISHDWTVSDGYVYELYAALKVLGASNGASIYIEDPFTFKLPDGVTFTSMSGSTYGAAAIPAVPEPSTWMLMAAGLAVMARLRRKSRDTHD